MYLRTCRVQIPLMSAADFYNCDSFFVHRHRMIERPSLNVQCCRLATCRPARCMKQVVGRKSWLAVRAGDVCDHAIVAIPVALGLVVALPDCYPASSVGANKCCFMLEIAARISVKVKVVP
jgi:hypothetical protein